MEASGGAGKEWGGEEVERQKTTTCGRDYFIRLSKGALIRERTLDWHLWMESSYLNQQEKQGRKGRGHNFWAGQGEGGSIWGGYRITRMNDKWILRESLVLKREVKKIVWIGRTLCWRRKGLWRKKRGNKSIANSRRGPKHNCGKRGGQKEIFQSWEEKNQKEIEKQGNIQCS